MGAKGTSACFQRHAHTRKTRHTVSSEISSLQLASEIQSFADL